MAVRDVDNREPLHRERRVRLVGDAAAVRAAVPDALDHTRGNGAPFLAARPLVDKPTDSAHVSGLRRGVKRALRVSERLPDPLPVVEALDPLSPFPAELSAHAEVAAELHHRIDERRRVPRRDQQTGLA